MNINNFGYSLQALSALQDFDGMQSHCHCPGRPVMYQQKQVPASGQLASMPTTNAAQAIQSRLMNQ